MPSVESADCEDYDDREAGRLKFSTTERVSSNPNNSKRNRTAGISVGSGDPLAQPSNLDSSEMGRGEDLRFVF